MAIQFRKPLGNLGRTWQTPPLFWRHIWSVEGYAHSQGGGDISFWFSFVDYVLVYSYAYVFVQLCLDVHVVHVVVLHIRHDSSYWLHVMQSAAPIGWHPSTLWDHQCYDWYADMVKVHKTILFHLQSKGKLVVFGWVCEQTQFPQKTPNSNYILLHITRSFQQSYCKPV